MHPHSRNRYNSHWGTDQAAEETAIKGEEDTPVIEVSLETATDHSQETAIDHQAEVSDEAESPGAIPITIKITLTQYKLTTSTCHTYPKKATWKLK